MPQQAGGRRPFGSVRPQRALISLLVLLALAAPGQFGSVSRAMVIDAYTQVSVFVAATLLLFYGAERLFSFDIGSVLRRSGIYSVPIAAGLGATPGCGGAVMVVAAYSSGNVSFGAVVAALTATMGDAAFLLIAIRPDAALVVLPLSFAVGIVSGWTIDKLFPNLGEIRVRGGKGSPAPVGETRFKDLAYLVLCAPGLAIGVLTLLQFELTGILDSLAAAIALSGTVLGLIIWSTSSFVTMSSSQDSPPTRTAEETSFISIWVIAAFLFYEYLVAFGGLNLDAFFGTVAPLLPLVGILVGFIPGCGPQILVATLYINGVIPFAAIVGNAISNDGDALFPAIAVDARAAALATIVSAVPALLVAYGLFFLAPGFMN
ncbi:MAG: arsenic efflux protein [Rhodobacteraceae bacterium]|nr:arsenic efflux protein [Paracoccaceae bacterium]